MTEETYRFETRIVSGLAPHWAIWLYRHGKCHTCGAREGGQWAEHPHWCWRMWACRAGQRYGRWAYRKQYAQRAVHEETIRTPNRKGRKPR